MVERSLSMREVPGSIPGASKTFSSTLCLPNYEKKFASSGNRTRAARVAGEHSTTEPTMLRCHMFKSSLLCHACVVGGRAPFTQNVKVAWGET